jgi:hypothetical protein
MTGADDPWPELPYAAWQPTLTTLHMWAQIVGKVKLELTPFLNEWWNVTFAAMARGLTTSVNTLISKSPIRRQPLRGFRASGGHVVAGHDFDSVEDD